jgi:hypothetical protein
MQPLDHFEQIGTRGFYRPVGAVTLEQAIETIAAGIERARELDLVDLVVNSLGLSGFAAPTTFGRYAFAVRWAEAAGGKVRVAFVARPELIDHQKIGMVMAKNRGLQSEVFVVEADAIQWLDKLMGVRP